MSFKKYIPRNDDLDKLDELLKIISSNNCIAFIGAGISVNKGYRSWEKLIHDETKAGYKKGLLEYSGITDPDIKKLKLPLIVDHCKTQIGDRKYYDFLIEEYERKANEISDNHSLTCRTNFSHIITTNFDPCLYDNSEGLIPNLRTYPGNELEILPKRTLYHIHGRAFLEKGELPDQLDKYLSQLIFGELSYEEAYDVGLEIKTFIYSILKKYTLLFIGFSMNDEVFSKSLKEILKARRQFINELSARHSLSCADNNIGYILLSYPKDDFEKIELFNKGKVILTDDEKERHLNTIDKFIEWERELNGVGLKVIGFNKQDDMYSGLTAVLQLIKNEAKWPGLDKPIESLDASLTASITGSII